MDLSENKLIDYKEWTKAFETYQLFADVMKDLVPKIVDSQVTTLEEAKKQIQKAFKNIPEAHDDDLLTSEEMRSWFEHLGIKCTEQQIESFFQIMDADGTNR